MNSGFFAFAYVLKLCTCHLSTKAFVRGLALNSKLAVPTATGEIALDSEINYSPSVELLLKS